MTTEEKEENQKLKEITVDILEYQQSNGLLGSHENPTSGGNHHDPVWVRSFGTADATRWPWRYSRSDGCQYNALCADFRGNGYTPMEPMLKGQLWLSNYALELDLRCRAPVALCGCSHSHRRVRGSMKHSDGHWSSVAEESGKYWPELGAMYARRTAQELSYISRPARRTETRLSRLAGRRSVKTDVQAALPCGNVGVAEALPVAEPEKLDWQGNESSVFHISGSEVYGVSSGGIPVSLSPVAQPTQGGEPDETEKDRQRREETLLKGQKAAGAWWGSLAKRRDWDQVAADLGVYQHSGFEVKSDPRRTKEYRDKVLEGLGFGQDCKERHPELSEADIAAAREVYGRKAAAMWLDGTPRTTVRHVKHDTIPTGPPTRLPPHSLKGEAAEWIDEKLEEEVKRGQLERGNSPWGSPPFPTRDFAAHKKQRKRRIVVDYRKVNARTLRAVYYVRNASDVIGQAAGSLWYTLVDAVTGFNHIVNTERARQMLAILSRSGQFLPRCLTFGPANGPEDFCYVIDRVYAPGRRGARRFCKEWLGYVDDLTIRTGRMVDGVQYTDQEYDLRVKKAACKARVDGQPMQEALRELGFEPKGLGSELRLGGARPGNLAPKGRPKTANEKAEDGETVESGAGSQSPYAHNASIERSLFVRCGAGLCRRLVVILYIWDRTGTRGRDGGGRGDAATAVGRSRFGSSFVGGEDQHGLIRTLGQQVSPAALAASTAAAAVMEDSSHGFVAPDGDTPRRSQAPRATDTVRERTRSSGKGNESRGRFPSAPSWESRPLEGRGAGRNTAWSAGPEVGSAFPSRREDRIAHLSNGDKECPGPEGGSWCGNLVYARSLGIGKDCFYCGCPANRIQLCGNRAMESDWIRNGQLLSRQERWYPISTVGLAVVTALAPRPAVTLRRTAVGRAGTGRITASGGPTATVKGAGETALLDHGSARFAADGTRVTRLFAANASSTGGILQKRQDYRLIWDREFWMLRTNGSGKSSKISRRSSARASKVQAQQSRTPCTGTLKENPLAGCKEPRSPSSYGIELADQRKRTRTARKPLHRRRLGRGSATLSMHKLGLRQRKGSGNGT